MQHLAEKIWSSAQEHLRSKLTADTYNMWFASLRASAVDNSHVTLEATNEFCEVWLKDNYSSLLQDAIAIAAGKQLEIKFKPAPGTVPMTNSRASHAWRIEKGTQASLLCLGLPWAPRPRLPWQSAHPWGPNQGEFPRLFCIG